jgi:hypothetical protein
MAESIESPVDTAINQQQRSNSGDFVSHRQQQENSDIVLSWEADNHDIPRVIDQQPASSESTAPTLRDLSLSTLSGGSPQTQCDNEAPLRSQVDRDPVGHALAHLLDLLSVDGGETPSINNAQAGEPDIAALGSVFSESEGRLGGHIEDEDANPRVSHVVTNAELRPGTKQPKDGDLASSIITTPSASSEASARYTVDCFPELPAGPLEWFVARLDTGSDDNLITLDALQRMGIEHLILLNTGPVDEIVGLDGNARITGELPLNFSIPKKNIPRVRARFKVVPAHDYVDAVLGVNFVHTHILEGCLGNGDASTSGWVRLLLAVLATGRLATHLP